MKKRICISLSPEIYDILRIRAKNEHRSISNTVEILILKTR